MPTAACANVWGCTNYYDYINEHTMITLHILLFMHMSCYLLAHTPTYTHMNTQVISALGHYTYLNMQQCLFQDFCSTWDKCLVPDFKGGNPLIKVGKPNPWGRGVEAPLTLREIDPVQYDLLSSSMMVTSVVCGRMVTGTSELPD